MLSPGVAPVSHASSTDPLAWMPGPDALAAGAPIVTMGKAIPSMSRPTNHDARLRNPCTAPPCVAGFCPAPVTLSSNATLGLATWRAIPKGEDIDDGKTV